LEEQHIQRKASFLFYTIWPTNLFLLVLDNFSKSTSDINWIYWTRWFLRWQIKEFDTVSIALAKVVLSLQPWNQHKRFGPHCHLGQMFCLNQLNMCGMWKQTKILKS
jgi:hypothetical protein